MHTLPNNDELDTIPVLPLNIPVAMPELPVSLAITSFEQFKAISEPMRSRILVIIQNQPATAKQLADRLGATPGAIGHHLHVLEEAGLAKIVARRLAHGIVANYYTRTARIFTYNLPQDVTGSVDPNLEIMNKARDEMVEALATIHDDLYRCNSFPHIRLSAERARHYSQRLRALVDDVLNETYDPDGNVYGVFIAMFKSPSYMQSPDATHSSDTD